ncbi:RdgB/HAM1 family non-canonical purine NTP pyrophosphatase [Spirosoma sp. KUDC1026]|uniref:RdgB/HAM1 family non-canonical purine NTP pyrophosphatase n=1 Tax=Spirosoma sp. KUDC1026 TaxID=2745947 RepID=UPI00159BDCA4|nr:RdgB/HAM1 family non-canonical purine NTP pyrophosphatase [Spirosoma sp. KUDC1026]QKZ12051.1 RdgB/HAM1 family non-canonical purine NTP pyrophosphatase [Spirosoma sp. KUDC1026]
MELCFATNNQHKLDEVAARLGDAFTLKTLRDIGCTDELPETSGTIPGNSRQKAEYVWTHFGESCFADDSGLEVDALNGEPGVDSAFYSGSRDASQNIQKLLTNLAGKPSRKARFITVFTLLLHGVEHQFEGIIEGDIIGEPQGTGGFGYDPIFRPRGYDKTFAQMSSEEKNAISHRAQALGKMIIYLQSQIS